MKKKLIVAFTIILFALIIFPLIMDRWIIGNDIPSNISNESWVSFFGGYSGAIITGTATFVTFYFTFFQMEKQNETQNRFSVLPYLDVSIDEPDIDYSGNEYLLQQKPEGIFRAMCLNNQLVEYGGRQVYGFLESINHKIIYEKVIYPYVAPELVQKKSVGIQLKQVTIKNIGLNSAISVNVYLNERLQWQFNLEKNAIYSFYYVLDESWFRKRVDIQLKFKDLLGNEYKQSCFVVHTPNQDLTGERFQKSVTQSPLLIKERSTDC